MIATIIAWIASHHALVGELVTLLMLVYNGMAQYPDMGGVAQWLHLALDAVSPFVRSDSAGVVGIHPMLTSSKQGTLKIPILQRSAAPAKAAA